MTTNEEIRRALEAIAVCADESKTIGHSGPLLSWIERYRDILDSVVIIGPGWLNFKKAADSMLWDLGLYDKARLDNPFGPQALGALTVLAGRAAKSQEALDASVAIPFPQGAR